MARFPVLLCLVFVGGPVAHAQPLVIDPAHRPLDYSNIVGKYAIQASAEPTSVEVEQDIILRIRIAGEGPKEYEPNRKNLHLFPASWQNDFHVQEMHEQHEVLRRYTAYRIAFDCSNAR